MSTWARSKNASRWTPFQSERERGQADRSDPARRSNPRTGRRRGRQEVLIVRPLCAPGLNRRTFFKSAAGLAAGLLAPAAAIAGDKLEVTRRVVTTDDAPTPYRSVTTFNNFYEFGSDKADPARNAKGFRARPWSVAVEGLCAKPGSYTLEDIVKPHPLEERIYRLRCVEGWSMVIPWVGFPLGDLLKRFEPAGSAQYVEFASVVRPEEMIGQRQRFPALLPWPYTEGLRIDEAMHPLTLIATGVYDEELPNQNGAPLRLVVPWKYGFKSIKSIVRIRFVDRQPKTTWMIEAPRNYAFYSNVNPGRTNSAFRDQSTERRIGELWMRKTLPFNGYGEQVSSLYAGMDLRKDY
jgi:methionine sulfoxide reductase catalytic subunit